MSPVQERPGRGDSPALMWMGHHSEYFFLGWASLTIAADVTAYPTPTGWVAIGALVLLLVSLALRFRYHDQRLCERCIAASPLDPQAAVTRWNRALRFYHFALSGLLMLPVLAAIFAGIAVHSRLLIMAANIALIVMLTGYFLMSSIHRRLYPWCPWCHWDEGGDEEISPDLPQVPQETR